MTTGAQCILGATAFLLLAAASSAGDGSDLLKGWQGEWDMSGGGVQLASEAATRKHGFPLPERLAKIKLVLKEDAFTIAGPDSTVKGKLISLKAKEKHVEADLILAKDDVKLSARIEFMPEGRWMLIINFPPKGRPDGSATAELKYVWQKRK